MTRKQEANGDPASERLRFLSKFNKLGNGCWIWNGSFNNQEYSCFHIKRNGTWVKILAHRYSYELIRGPVPPGMELDHLCRDTRCINPDHLEAVTHQKNTERGEAGTYKRTTSKTYCIHGHQYSEENTYINKHGFRSCKACRKLAYARYILKKRGEIK